MFLFRVDIFRPGCVDHIAGLTQDEAMNCMREEILTSVKYNDPDLYLRLSMYEIEEETNEQISG